MDEVRRVMEEPETMRTLFEPWPTATLTAMTSLNPGHRRTWTDILWCRYSVIIIYIYLVIEISICAFIYCYNLSLKSIDTIYPYNLSLQSIAYRYNLSLALQSIITLIFQNQFRHLVDSTFSWTACTRWRRSCATSTRPTWDSRSSMDLTQVEPDLIWLQIFQEDVSMCILADKYIQKNYLQKLNHQNNIVKIVTLRVNNFEMS